MTRSSSTASTEATHNWTKGSPWCSLGYIGYCHLGKPRVYSPSYEGCNTEAQEFMAANPKYLTRKGLFIYKLILGEERKFIKRIQNVDNT